MGKTFAISDTWFNRPCESNYGENHLEYNKNIISNWNSIVNDDDRVYILGGFGICDTYDIVFELKGNLIFLNTFFSTDEIESRNNMKELIDKSVNKKLKERIVFSENQIELIPKKDIILSYFPLVDWYGKKSGSLCFHGMYEETNMNNYNFCCNASKWNFKPVDIDEVKTNISKFKSMV